MQSSSGPTAFRVTCVTDQGDAGFNYFCSVSSFRAIKYLMGFTIPAIAVVSMGVGNVWVFLPVVYAFMLIPVVESIVPPDARNLSKLEEELIKDDPLYDRILYLHVPIQFFVLLFFLSSIQQPGLMRYEKAGMILSMGICCGVIGINVAHELGHRVTRHERFMAVLLLITSLYGHFYVEHNKGHHKHVSTPEDPSSARYNEPIYAFYFRTISMSLISACRIQRHELRSGRHPFFSLQNVLLYIFLAEAIFCVLIAWYFGWFGLICFTLSAVIGFLLLESVQYIEHYGLRRIKKSSGMYERVMPRHSWNSNHILGRAVLYELTRHSDHHFLASRKYQTLRSSDDAPQLPAGYPAMILLALVPPLFFNIMNHRVRNLNEQHTEN